jgi:transposase
MKNKYIKSSRVSEAKFRKLLFGFSIDLTATQISLFAKLNRNTVNGILQLLRKRLAERCEKATPFKGEIELDESYFGAKRQKGKRGRGASKKTIVFGIYKRNGAVYTQIINNCTRETLQKIVKQKVNLASIIYTDGWMGYHGLVDLGYQKHYRVAHDKDEFVRGNSHINGIEGFWGFVKTRLTRFKGTSKSTFYLHLKESEYRYNHRDMDLYKLLMNMLRFHPLNSLN